MSYFFIEELKRAFISKRTILAFALTFLLFFFGMGNAFFHFLSGDVDVFYVFMNGYNSGASSYLALLFPLIAAIPYATSYLEDQKSGMASYIVIRIGQFRYSFVRFIVNGLVGGAVLFLPSFLITLLLSCLKWLTGAPWINNRTHETFIVFENLGMTSVPLMLLSMFITILLWIYNCYVNTWLSNNYSQ